VKGATLRHKPIRDAFLNPILVRTTSSRRRRCCCYLMLVCTSRHRCPGRAGVHDVPDCLGTSFSDVQHNGFEFELAYLLYSHNYFVA
jgi:hypothetical protein